MEPFNIKIPVQNTEVTITILPTEEDYFKIVYYGGVLGAIKYRKNSKKWVLVPEEEVIAGDLPPYSNDSGENRIEISLDSETIVKIGLEILKIKSF